MKTSLCEASFLVCGTLLAIQPIVEAGSWDPIGSPDFHDRKAGGVNELIGVDLSDTQNVFDLLDRVGFLLF